MYEKLKNTLRTVDMLYLTEDKLEDDYHLMPFRLVCEHIILSNFEKAWEIYMTIKPGIILIHVMTDAELVIKFIKKLRALNSKCTIVVLTSDTLQEELRSMLDSDIQELLTHPITYEKLIVSLESSIDYDNLYYYLSNSLLFEPNKSAFVLEDRRRIDLTRKETTLLVLLIQNRERIVTYYEIESRVWLNESMSRNTLTSIVRNIRKKAESDNIIKNHSGQGYQLGKL